MRRPTDQGAGDSGATITTAPVYLRLQKRAQAESAPERAHPKLARWRRGSLAFFAFFAFCWAVFLLVRHVESDARFRLHSIELRGGKFVSALEVEEVFFPDRDQSIYLIPLDERRREVERIPWVRSATVARVLPDHVAVTVEERAPVAFLWTRRGIALVDGEGVILDTPEQSQWTFPVLRGVSEQEPVEKRKARMERYLKLRDALGQQKGEMPPEISEVDLADAADLAVVVTDAYGAVRLHLGEERFPDRYETYRSHIAEWRQQFNAIQSIDLRYEGQVVIQSSVPTTLRLDQKPGAAPAKFSGATSPKRIPVATTAEPSRTAL